jgi:AraC-like DNA-binding protein
MSMESSFTTTTILRTARSLPPQSGRRAVERLGSGHRPRPAADLAAPRTQPTEDSWNDGASEGRDCGSPVHAFDAGSSLAPEWSSVIDHLSQFWRSPVPPPSWWEGHAGFRARVETLTAPRRCYPECESGEGAPSASTISFHLILAGSGLFRLGDQEPQELGPGRGFFASEAAVVHHYLPEGSLGLTLATIDVSHPYLSGRLSERARSVGSLVDVRPEEALTASVVRLVRGSMMKDFQDQFEVERAIFDFVLAFERWVRQATKQVREDERLLDDVRARVLARLPKAIEVSSLAAEFGMSRSHFSHFFRVRTGITPAHFATQVRIQTVERMLLDTYKPLKIIADACGFANANHLCKVFRRFRQLTPTAFRQALRVSGDRGIDCIPGDRVSVSSAEST